MERNPTHLVIRSVSMVVLESKVIAEDTEVFLTRFYLGIQFQTSESIEERK